MAERHAPRGDKLCVVWLLCGLAACPAAEPRGSEAAGRALPPGAVARLGTARWPHETQRALLIYSPDGSYLACGGLPPRDARDWGNHHPIHIIDGRTGRVLRELPGHDGQVRTMAVAKTGKWIVSAGDDRTVRLWDADRGGLLWTCVDVDAAELGFSADQKRVFAAAGGVVRALDAVDGRAVQQFDWRNETTKPAADDSLESILRNIDPSGRLKVVETTEVDGGWDVELQDKAGRKQYLRIRRPARNRDPVSDTTDQLLPDGATASVPAGPNQLQFRDLATGADAPRPKSSSSVLALASTDDGRTVVRRYFWPSSFHSSVLLGSDMALVSIEPATGRVAETLATWTERKLCGPTCLAVSANGQWAARVRQIAWHLVEVRLSDLRRRTERPAFTCGLLSEPAPPLPDAHAADSDEVRFRDVIADPARRWRVVSPAAALSPDGARLAIHLRHRVRIWESSSGRELTDDPQGSVADLNAEHQAIVDAVVFSPDGSQVVTASRDGDICVWSASTGQPIHRYGHRWREGSETSAAFSPDGLWLAVDRAKIIDIFSLVDDRKKSLPPALDPRRHPLLSKYSPAALAFSTDGRELLAFFRPAGALARWNVATGQLIATLEPDVAPSDEPVAAAKSYDPMRNGLGFSPGLRSLAANQFGCAVHFVWDTHTGRQRFKSVPGKYTTSRITPDEKTLTLGTFAGEIQLIDLRRGQVARTLQGPPGPSCPRALLEDGQILVCDHADATSRFWDLATGKELFRLAGHPIRACSPDERWAATVSSRYEFSPAEFAALSPLDRNELEKWPVPQTVLVWDLRRLSRMRRPSGP